MFSAGTMLVTGCADSSLRDRLEYRLLFAEDGSERESPSAKLALDLLAMPKESRRVYLDELCALVASANGYSQLVAASAVVKMLDADPEAMLSRTAATNFATATIAVRPLPSVPLVVRMGQRALPPEALNLFDPNCSIEVEGNLHLLQAGLPEGWKVLQVAVVANDQTLIPSESRGRNDGPLLISPEGLWEVVDQLGEWNITTRCKLQTRAGYEVYVEGTQVIRVVDVAGEDSLRQ